MLWVIVKKELKRVFSDRRLVFSAFILPAVGIYILYSLMGTMMGEMFEDRDQHQSIVHVYEAPASFLDYYENHKDDLGMMITFDQADFEADLIGVKDGNVDLVVMFEEGFDQKILEYQTLEQVPEIKTYYNPSEDYSYPARNKFVMQLLEGYELAMLGERFGHENYAKAFMVDVTNDESEVMDESKAMGIGLSLILPMLIAILLFAGAMGIGLDTIAGEKERGTMATLLMTPVNRETIAMGKLIGLAIVAFVSAACSFIAIMASLPNVGGMLSGGRDISITSLSFTVFQYVQLLVIMLVLVGMYVGLICITSVRAKSIKEAGTYVSPIYMIVMFASFSTMFTTGEPALIQFAIPILGNVLAIKQLFMFQLGMDAFLLSTIVSIVITGILILMITRSFNNEKVMLNA
jgi:sodium transport system permease protein